MVVARDSTGPCGEPTPTRIRLRPDVLANKMMVLTWSGLMLVSLVLGIALGLSLMLVAVALTPARVMRRSVAVIVEDRRETLLYGGLAAALGIGLGLGITLMLS
jgi:hypothetical protein